MSLYRFPSNIVYFILVQNSTKTSGEVGRTFGNDTLPKFFPPIVDWKHSYALRQHHRDWSLLQQSRRDDDWKTGFSFTPWLIEVKTFWHLKNHSSTYTHCPHSSRSAKLFKIFFLINDRPWSSAKPVIDIMEQIKSVLFGFKWAQKYFNKVLKYIIFLIMFMLRWSGP